MSRQSDDHVRQTRRRPRLRTAHRSPIVRVCLVIVVILLGEVLLVAGLPVKDRDVMLGILAASALACSWWLVLVLERTSRRKMLRLGEEATAQAVANARRRRRGWRIVNDFHRLGRVDVGQVLVGPGGVYVIESRWASKYYELGERSIVGIHGREPIAQARDDAQRVERLLRDGPDRIEVTVQPMVVVWGPRALMLDAGWTTVDGVLVCEGRQEEQWLNRLDDSRLDQPTVQRISEALTGLITSPVDQPVNAPER
jgi:Nuclease-related domain